MWSARRSWRGFELCDPSHLLGVGVLVIPASHVRPRSHSMTTITFAGWPTSGIVSPDKRIPTPRYAISACSLPCRTPRLSVVAPSDAAQAFTWSSSCLAIPRRRWDGATHIPTSSRRFGFPDRPPTPTATPTKASSSATNHRPVMARSRHFASSYADSRSKVEVNASGASRKDRRRTSRMSRHSSGLTARISIICGRRLVGAEPAERETSCNCVPPSRRQCSREVSPSIRELRIAG